MAEGDDLEVADGDGAVGVGVEDLVVVVGLSVDAAVLGEDRLRALARAGCGG